MPRKDPNKETVPPRLTPSQAISLLRRQSERAEEIKRLGRRDPKVDAWANTCENVLEQAFGMPNGLRHQNTQAFRGAEGLPHYTLNTDFDFQRSHEVRTERRKVLLESFIEQLTDLAPPSATTAPDQYKFHSEIELVAGELYRSGHYKQAALEAYIRVIEQVKRLSQIPDDGDSLMNKAFACDRQTPKIQFNSLQTESERDEQRAFMFLFKGIVALRNSKAHSNVLFNDPLRGHDYLALASVLMRVLEIAKVNP